MTRLISQYESSFGVSEEDEAVRMRAEYGWQRACTLAHVFEETACGPHKAFWFRVQCLLAAQNDGVLPASIKKEREAQRPPRAHRLTVNVNGCMISRTEFMTWLRSKKFPN